MDSGDDSSDLEDVSESLRAGPSNISGQTKYSVKSEHINPPIVVTTYKDPETKLQKVLIVVSLPLGSTKVQFEVNDSGKSCFFKFCWPDLIYDSTKIFKQEVEAGTITTYHPKILAFEDALEKARANIEDKPQSILSIKLPIEVKTERNTFKIEKKTVETNSVYQIELESYQKPYEVKSSEKFID